MAPPGSATPYHHGNLRAALVEAGLAMAKEAGPDRIALREVARRVGVSPNAVYRHFADRDELLDAISQVAMEALTAAMSERLSRLPADLDPVALARARLSATGAAYVGFALAEPGLFRVAFASKADGADDSPLGPPTGEGPYGVLNAVLDELVEVGYLDRERRPGAELVCWSAVHGFAELCLDGPLRMLPADLREGALARLLDTVDRGLGGAA